jgi:two-component system C4-dicarboxylate transport sensor histidine kinase DctB
MTTPATSEAELLIAANRADTLETVLGWLLHDVRTPTQVLTLLPQLLSGPDQASDWHDAVREACTHLSSDLRLLDRVLLRAKDRRTAQPVDLGATLRLVNELFATRRSQFRTDITAALDAALPPVSAIPEDLEHALINLVLNAAEADDGDDGHICFRGEVARGTVVLRLEDNGPGVAAPIRERLFQPFTTTKPSRRGLGLYVARALVSRVGGEISCEEAEPRGARFVLRMPIWRSGSPQEHLLH